ncbi:RING/FYVE/PHD zinc finger protein, partial [Trifolium pratense]
EEKGADTGVEEKVGDTGVGPDIKWRVLSWRLVASGENKQLSNEYRQVLSKAVSIFHEQFDPIVDSSSGRDFIPAMLFGKNIHGQDFAGMYCAVLTVNQVVVSAGVFRVFGPEVAELPLVATDGKYQGQGYFQCLFSCIERLLRSLSVKNLVLPAAEEAKYIWTNKFKFTKLEQDEINNYKRFYRMMVFQGTSTLQKPVCALPRYTFIQSVQSGSAFLVLFVVSITDTQDFGRGEVNLSYLKGFSVCFVKNLFIPLPLLSFDISSSSVFMTLLSFPLKYKLKAVARDPRLDRSESGLQFFFRPEPGQAWSTAY